MAIVTASNYHPHDYSRPFDSIYTLGLALVYQASLGTRGRYTTVDNAATAAVAAAATVIAHINWCLYVFLLPLLFCVNEKKKQTKQQRSSEIQQMQQVNETQ